jgi:histidinol-phosphatase (PHP family)
MSSPFMPSGPASAVMPAPVDLHIHSTCSVDGRSTISEYAQQAKRLGMLEVGFCEHVDFDPRDHDCGFLNTESYDRELALAREVVPDLSLRQGVEVSCQQSRQDEIRAWLRTHPWDYVMLSVHLVDYADGWAIVSVPSSSKEYFSTHSIREAFEPYFEELLFAAGSGLGDILGHFDLIKRYGSACYGPFDPLPFKDQIHGILEKAVENGVGLEINTSGWRQAPGESYPGRDILRWYRGLGGEILTVGSDAHHALDLGAGSNLALTLARETGFRAICSFANRQIRWFDL